MSKLVNYSRHSESLNIRKNSEIEDIFLWSQRFVDFPTYFKDSLLPQRCQKKRKDVGYKLLLGFELNPTELMIKFKVYYFDFFTTNVAFHFCAEQWFVTHL